MKIFWLCNVEIPIISETRGSSSCVFGGWLDNISRYLSKDNELTICYMSNEYTFLESDNNTYIGFVEDDAQKILTELFDDNCFDLYHIWGTEYCHSSICISLLEKRGLLDRAIINIQGLVSVCARHYAEGIPSNIIKKKTLVEYKFGNVINRGIKSFLKQGEYERDVIRKSLNFVGRTEWDKACVLEINPNANYYCCNENLRDCFYDDDSVWNINSVNEHTIFVSQCSYPIKGFHYLLEAMPIILKQYPDAKIITTGDDLLRYQGYRVLFLDSYKKYLRDLIDKYDLFDKIEFKGFLTAEQMKEEYLSANVFVSASTIENSPNSVGEAMILGCPVVSSYVGGAIDMIGNNGGYLYQSSSVEMLAYNVCKVFKDEKKTQEISVNARKRALKTHDRNINNSKMIDIYNKIVS